MSARQIYTAAALLALLAPLLPAQEQRHITPVFGVSLGALAIESAAATQAQVGDRSYGIQLDAGVLLRRHFFLGIDLGGQFLDDKAQFTQNTTGGEMKSSATTTYFSAIVGVRTGALPVLPVDLALNAGASASMTDRSIENCTDCRVDDLDIPAGAFVEPVLLFGRGRWRLRAADRIYLAGDGMRSIFSVGAQFQPQRK